MQCKPKRSLNVSWSSRITPSFLSKLNGIIVDEPSWTGAVLMVAEKMRSSIFARLSCRWCSLIHAEMSTSQAEIMQVPLDHLVEMSGRAEFHQHSNGIAMVGKTTVCANMMGPSVYREEEGSKNWSMRNTNDQLMWFGYLSSQSNPEGPTCEVRLKWVECSSGDAQRRECGQTDLMIDSVKSSR